jgi:hypothetical protein
MRKSDLKFFVTYGFTFVLASILTFFYRDWVLLMEDRLLDSRSAEHIAPLLAFTVVYIGFFVLIIKMAQFNIRCHVMVDVYSSADKYHNNSDLPKVIQSTAVGYEKYTFVILIIGSMIGLLMPFRGIV